MMPHPTIHNTKFFIIIGCDLVSRDDSALYSNVIFISRLAKSVLCLPSESIHIYAPTDPYAQISSDEIRLRFRRDLYVSSITDEDIKFKISRGREDTFNSIQRKVNPDTFAYLFFLDHGSPSSFGEGFQIEAGEFHTFLSTLKCQAKRVYVHSCYSGIIVDFEKLCFALSDRDLYIFKSNQEFFGLWLEFLLRSDIHSLKKGVELYSHISDSTLNITGTLREMVKLFEEFTKIIKYIKVKDTNITLNVLRRNLNQHSMSKISSQSDVKSMSAAARPGTRIFIESAIALGHESVSELTNLLLLLQDETIQSQEDCEIIQKFLNFAQGTYGENMTLFRLKTLSNQMKDIIQHFISIGDFPYSSYAQFFKFVSERSQNELRDILVINDFKILSSSSSCSTSMQYQSVIIKQGELASNQTLQNDPVTCEYLYQMLTSSSPIGMDLRTVVDVVRLMRNVANNKDDKFVFQTPQYFIAESTSDDSFQAILTENDMHLSFYEMIEFCGYSKVPTTKIESMVLPPVIINVKKVNLETDSIEQINTYLTDLDGTSLLDENHSIIGKIDNSWFITEKDEFLSFRSTSSIKLENDSANPIPTERDTQTFQITDTVNLSYDMLASPKTFQPFPSPDDDLFDIRYLKVGTNMKCGYLNLNKHDMERNARWLIVYNTIRLFSYHLKEFGINFDYKFITEPSRKDDRILSGNAYFTCFEKGDRILSGLSCEFTPMIATDLNRFFADNKDKNEILDKAFHRSSKEAKYFVEKNIDRVMEPLRRFVYHRCTGDDSTTELLDPKHEKIPLDVPNLADYSY